MAVETKTPAYMQPPRRVRRPRRGFNQTALIAWLDEQERLIRMRGLPTEVVEEFDPLHNLPQSQDEQGRRTLLFRFTTNLESYIADQIQSKIVEGVKSRFMLKLSAVVELRNIADDRKMDFYQDIGASRFETLAASQTWVSQQEELRLETQRRPNTQWSYEKTKMVYVKVILDRHPLFVGRGPLPDRLRNKHGILSLDTYWDNCCLFRCIAVRWGTDVRYNMRKTRELEESFFAQRPGLCNRLTAKHLPLLEKHFKQGIAAYTVQPNGDFVLTHLPANYDKVGRPVLTMGLYDGHAFLIRDLKQVARDYTCGVCQTRFTQSTHLIRHASTCSGRRTKLNWPNNRIRAPASAYERAFYSKSYFSFMAIKWLEWEANKRGIHIHHALCVHGSERHIVNAPVGGYHHETRTVFQYHGCHWHGCKQCYQTPAERQEVVRRNKQGRVITRQEAYDDTLKRTQDLRAAGYTVVEKWDHEEPTPWAATRCPEKQMKTYPHAIVYDFESYQDTSKAERPTRDLSYESEHVPISVSIADTLHPEPEYIVYRDPAELIHRFYQSLERHHAAIVADVVNKFGFADTVSLSDSQSKEILRWVTQVPVLGFNSGHYDLKLIRQYFIPLMTQDSEVYAAEKNGRIMFINTPKFKFLDVLNYLAPGITYDKWVKTYGATLTKSWLPYEWFDSPDKLDFPGLPPYLAWYSKLKGSYVLSLKEYDNCHRVFNERGMRTFCDWFEYYNNLDVAPFLEALQKIKEFYTNLGVDIFKDAVSLPSVSQYYILRKTLQGHKGYKPPELYAPNKEAYGMLKAAVVGGPSLVFTRKHVAGETRIRSHQYEDARLVKRILGYDANSLYPSTMMKEFIEAVERQNKTLYTRDEEEVDKHLCSAWFTDLEEIGNAYKIELRKSKLAIDRPFQVGIVVYQLAKLHMLQFYYEFLDFYLDRRDFELIQMDTDSMYFALSHEKLEDAIKAGYESQFEEDKKLWLAWDKWSKHEPGLFKLEKQATHGIALCSKCYHMEDRRRCPPRV